MPLVYYLKLKLWFGLLPSLTLRLWLPPADVCCCYSYCWYYYCYYFDDAFILSSMAAPPIVYCSFAFALSFAFNPSY